jgi:hypothetical protein
VIRRLLLFVLLAAMTAAIVNPGNFGSIDTQRRLQVARWIRLGEPPVRPGDRTFGLMNRWGARQAWYGIGQSLVLAPFDWMASAAVAAVARRFGLDAVKREQLVELLIAFLMQSLLTACSLALAHQVLALLGFGPRAAMAGALALLFATTYLFYVQTAQENNLLLTMSLAALYGILRYGENGRARWAALAGGACGLAILTRLPSLLEAAVFFGLAVSLGCRPIQFLKGYGPPVMAALAIDRWYQWHRFGNVTHTYARELGEQLRRAGDPASFPFSYPFWKGFFGTLFSPDKSIFLFDPLLLVLIAAAAWNWRKLERPVRMALVWLTALMLLYASFYARYFDFGGDVTWAHRFVATQVELLALFAVPLLSFGSGLPRAGRVLAWVLVGASVMLQAASTTLSPNVEITQRENGDRHGVIVNRAINLVDLGLGRENGPRFSGLPTEWRMMYYLPFQLRLRFAELSRVAIAAWAALLLALPIAVAALWKSTRDYHKPYAST